MTDITSDRTQAPALPWAKRNLLVWDLPVRVFHWLMVASFAGAYLTAETERWRLLHVTLGYTMAGLVGLRIVWGLVGTRHARFASFVRGPSAAIAYLGAVLGGRPKRHIGHNPAGALAIVALLGLTLAVAASGWATFDQVGGQWLEELHEGAAGVMLTLVGIHIVAVLLASWQQRENLVGAMIDGRKAGPAQDGVRSARRSVAVLMVAAVLGFWWLQWQSAPSAGPLRPHAAQSKVQDSDDD